MDGDVFEKPGRRLINTYLNILIVIAFRIEWLLMRGNAYILYFLHKPK